MTVAEIVADVDSALGPPRVVSLPVIVIVVLDVLRVRGLIDVEPLADWPGGAPVEPQTS